MRKIYLFICLAVAGIVNLHAQLNTIVTGSGYPTGLLYDNQTLYVSDFSGNKVSKIDLNAENMQIVPLISIDGPTSLLMYNNELYVLSAEGGKLVKIDLSTDPVTSEDIIVDLRGPLDMALHGSELYISETDKISKYDLAGDTTDKTVILEVEYPSGLAVYGDELYYAGFYEDIIYKLNIAKEDFTKQTVATGVGGPWDLDIVGDKLFIAEYNTGKVSSIDLFETDNSYKIEASGLEMIVALAHFDNRIFTGEWGNNGRISYFDVFSTMGTLESSTSKLNFSKFPNSKSFVFNGLESSTKYYISNLNGQKLLNGIADNGVAIDCSTLIDGVYVIKLESGESFKFINK